MKKEYITASDFMCELSFRQSIVKQSK